jgi:PAS domain S-box-containing protein
MPDDGEQPPIPIEELSEAVRNSAVPVALLDLQSLRWVALSGPGAELLQLDPAAPGEIDIFALLSDPDAARPAIEQIRAGRLDAYEARRVLRRADGSLVKTAIYVRVVDEGDERSHAIVVLVDLDGPRLGACPEFDDVDATVGLADSDRRIELISSDVTSLLGYSPAGCIGRALVDLVHPSDVGALLDLFARVATDNVSAGVRVRGRTASGSWRPIDVAIGPVQRNESAVGFAALPAQPITVAPGRVATDRAAELEQHLMRIAREVEAAGLIDGAAQIPDPERVPGLADLTSRQWQILTRLLQGDRVSTIANEMSLRPSTVRNHLSTIYRKLGVHSQVELIEKLRPAE